MGTYREQLEAKGFKVTSDEYADHMATLQAIYGFLPALSEFVHRAYASGKINNTESDTLTAAMGILRNMQVPMCKLERGSTDT